MRYAAQRIGTRQWLHQDLPLAGVDRTRVLSGPGGLTATITPELRDLYADDGLRVIEKWGTYVYAIPDGGGDPTGGGIVVDINHEETGLRLVCAGFTTYPHGELFDDAVNWGPVVGNGTIANPQVPRPDPLRIVRDLWDWLQAREDSNLRVRVVGDTTSRVTIGDYDEPYRLRWWEEPDIGTEIDNLAAYTPFGYVEEYRWSATGNDVDRLLRIGHPRVGRRRTDLRFAVGENIALPVIAEETGDDFANSIVGIGNGEGRKMVRVDSTVRDGRLRRTKVVTDKTVKSQNVMRATVTGLRERTSGALDYDITSVAVKEHDNAPLAALQVGDDILVQAVLPSLGSVEKWVRILSITEGDNPEAAVLSTQRSDAFLYSSTLTVD